MSVNDSMTSENNCNCNNNNIPSSHGYGLFKCGSCVCDFLNGV